MRCGARTGRAANHDVSGFQSPLEFSGALQPAIGFLTPRRALEGRVPDALGAFRRARSTRHAPVHTSTHRHHGRPRHAGAQAQRHDPRRLDRRHSHRSLRVPRRAGRPVQVIAPRARIAQGGGLGFGERGRLGGAARNAGGAERGRRAEDERFLRREDVRGVTSTPRGLRFAESARRVKATASSRTPWPPCITPSSSA